MTKKSCFFLITILLISIFEATSIEGVFSQTPSQLDPNKIPKWVNQLAQAPPVYAANNITDTSGKLIRQEYIVTIKEFKQQLLPKIDSSGNPTGFGPSTVWGFEGEAKDAVTGESMGLVHSTPGCSFEAIRGVPVQVKWLNALIDASGNPLPNLFAVDPTLNWANPNHIQAPNPSSVPPGVYSQAKSPVPISMHLHGGEVASSSDGNPDSWWTPNGLHGIAYNTEVPTDDNAAVFVYPNEQQATTLWYHDHAMGITRLNVMSGLAGFYLLRSPDDQVSPSLPKGEFEVPLAIQDRNFLPDGSLYYPRKGIDAAVHPYWNPTFFGNTIMVNGLVWPNMEVKQGQYRLRILDGSNTRFYTLHFSNGMSFTQIGSDGGYLKAPVSLTSLVISPGERVDLLVDFSNIQAGEKVILQNLDPALTDNEKQNVGQIMQFTVGNTKGLPPQTLPSELNPTLKGSFPNLPSPTKTRTLTLVEQGTAPNTIAMLLDGLIYDAPATEKPQIGSTEDWVIINPTMNSHPIHLHLVQFQLVERQTIASTQYMNDWETLNGNLPLNHTAKNLEINRYFEGNPTSPSSNEQCWKDTIQADAGMVTVIRARFTSQDGSNYGFDPTNGPGYVWHCHILEHEDNSMMRPLIIVGSSIPMTPLIIVIAAIVVVALVGLIVFRRFRKKSVKK
ncbi:MAG: multicopper oxidase family protein [Ignavibacteria bacterium]